MTPALEQQWSKVPGGLARLRGLGGSDAPAAVGESPFMTAFELYQQKIGAAPPGDETKSMRNGHLLEPSIAAIYEAETGLVLRTHPMIWHPKHVFMFCHPDRIVVGGDGRNVQIKTANPFQSRDWGEPGTDEVPTHVAIQVNHEMACLDVGLTDVALLLGNQLRVYHVTRNERLIERLVALEAAFWDRVQKRQPPEPDFTHRSTLPLLKALYRIDPSQIIEGDDDLLRLAQDNRRLGEEVGTLTREREAVQAEILYRMGDAAMASFPKVGMELLRKMIHRRGYPVPACDYPQLTFRERKGRA